jgi:hypothetical protein
LEGHEDPRVRLRALKAIPPSQRTAEIRDRLVIDPDPGVRAESLNVPRADVELCVRLMRTDPAPVVRRAAAMAVRFTQAVGSEAFIAVLPNESDPSVRAMLLSCLTYRPRDHVNAAAIASFLDDGNRFLRSQAAQALRTVRDAGMVAGIARRIEVEDDPGVLMGLLRQPRLLAYAPQLRPFLEQRQPRSDGERHALDAALSSGADLVELRFPDGEWIAVAFGEERRALGEAPVEAARIVPCSHCGGGVRVIGFLEWRYRDDDHFAYSEDGYEADLRGACHQCATAARRIVLVTGERSRSTDILTVSCQDLRLA